MNTASPGMQKVQISGMPKETDGVKQTAPRTSIRFTHVPQTAAADETALLSAWKTVIRSGTFLLGKQNEALLRRLTGMLHGGHVTLTASGHDALLITLQSLRLKHADEVLFPVNSNYTAYAVALSGATPVPCDVDNNGQLDILDLSRRRTKRTRVVIAVHLYGLTGDLDAFVAYCKKHGIILIEDVAQAFGSTWRGRMLGTLGTAGCFSFYPTKNLGSPGEGGAVWTKTVSLANRISAATRYGARHKFDSQFLSGHSRMPELTAAGILVFLSHFRKDAAARRRVDAWYRSALAPLTETGSVRILTSHPHSTPVPHLFVIESKKRDQLRAYLARQGIPTLVHYPVPTHLVPSFRYLGYQRGDFPVAERLCRSIVSLPFHQHLTRNQVQQVSRAVQSWYETPPRS